MKRDASCRICLVTEELSFGKGSGGIGGAFHELALALRTGGHSVDLVYLPADVSTKATQALVDYYDDRGIRIVDPAINEFVWEPFSYERRAYGIFRHLAAATEAYDFIHFHDYKGLGFASLSAKSQRLAFSNTTLIVQVHGPTRWTLQANGYPFRHEDQLKIDFMERQSIARADKLVSPSHYMVDWLKQNNWTLPPADRIRVIQNVSSHLGMLLGQTRSNGEIVACREIIFFGRHEERKGIVTFCDALDLINEDLASANVPVTFLGDFGIIKGEASPLYLTDRSTKWRFPIQFLPDFDRLSACRYLAVRKRSLVVVPSFFENSPYTVLETAITGRPLITSAEGGAAELLDPALVPLLTCQIERRSLAKKLLIESFEALNAYLLQRCRRRMADCLRGHEETIGERLKHDLAALQTSLPAAYDACEKVATTVSSLSLVRYRRNDYSVPTTYGHRDVLVRGYVHEVVISCGAEVIARHPRPTSGKTSYSSRCTT